VSSRLVTWYTAPPRPPVAFFPKPSAPGNATVAPVAPAPPPSGAPPVPLELEPLEPVPEVLPEDDPAAPPSSPVAPPAEPPLLAAPPDEPVPPVDPPPPLEAPEEAPEPVEGCPPAPLEVPPDEAPAPPVTGEPPPGAPPDEPPPVVAPVAVPLLLCEHAPKRPAPRMAMATRRCLLVMMRPLESYWLVETTITRETQIWVTLRYDHAIDKRPMIVGDDKLLDGDGARPSRKSQSMDSLVPLAIVAAIMAALGSACASPSAAPAFRDTASLVEARTGHRISRAGTSIR
jgi:hypothetical protein